MKKWIIGFLLISPTLRAQELPATTEQQMEDLTEISEGDPDDDSYWQQLEPYRRHPLDLNLADEDDLNDLPLLSALQIESLLSYRRLLGKFISIYELQAIPYWDIATIKKLKPFVTVSIAGSERDRFPKRFRGGDQLLLFRLGTILEKSKGFERDGGGAKFNGSPLKAFFRYRYSYKNLLQFGVTGEKDAGEQFFKGGQPKGFDFYSVHLFARKIGIIEALALGDFTVNMGQGLIQWQSLAFRKSGDVMQVKRQSPALRPYSSAGEFNFHRGIGVSLRKKRTELTLFGSYRVLDGNVNPDSLSAGETIGSFSSSGNHRTDAELADRHAVRQKAGGASLKIRLAGLHLGINGIWHAFSTPVRKRDEPYNQFAISGTEWFNASVDYGYTWRNIHVFGEAAVDKQMDRAILNGLMISVDRRADISIVYRDLSPRYQAVRGNAFTESSSPSNEQGIFAGVSVRPFDNWRFDLYADFFRFPWLRYLADAPGDGREFFVQAVYTIFKNAELTLRYRSETKQGNYPDNPTVTNYLVSIPRRNLRFQFAYGVNKATTVRSRFEWNWYGAGDELAESGSLLFFDWVHKPMTKRYSLAVRVQFFETGGYNSRIYAYEQDLLFSYSVPAFFDQGTRYYAVVNYDIMKNAGLSLKWAQTVYKGKNAIGSGLDEIGGNKKSELKLQLKYLFH